MGETLRETSIGTQDRTNTIPLFIRGLSLPSLNLQICLNPRERRNYQQAKINHSFTKILNIIGVHTIKGKRKHFPCFVYIPQLQSLRTINPPSSEGHSHSLPSSFSCDISLILNVQRVVKQQVWQNCDSCLQKWKGVIVCAHTNKQNKALDGMHSHISRLPTFLSMCSQIYSEEKRKNGMWLL